MEHPNTPPDSQQKSTRTAAAVAAPAGVVARRKGKVSSGQASSSIGRGSSSAAGLVPLGRRSGSAAGVLLVGRGSGPTAGVLPVGRGSGPAAPLFPISNNGSSMAASGAAESSPVGGFNSHGGGDFYGRTASPPAGFPISPSPYQAWWGSDGTSPASSSFPYSDSTWDNNSHPPGGFMGILNSQSNLHFAGSASHYAPFKAPRSTDVEGNFASKDASSSPDVEITSDNQAVEVDEDTENVRTEKRIMWTPEEDERLMSDWIEHSTDSAAGADRKGEAYWGDVTKAYNKKTPPQRRSGVKQAKDRWHKINRWCYLFECDYVKARRVFTSGYSDEMWMDAAEKFYEDHKIGPFVIKNIWKICRKVAKWITYNEELKNARKRKSYHLEEDVENGESENDMLKRPPGQKAAKRARKGKTKAIGDDGTSKESAINVEKLDTWSKMQEESNANRLKVLELQQKLSSDKIETTRLAHLTAQENREAKKLEIEGRKLEMESKKFEKESKMMDAYNNLISQDTSSMTDDEKAERVAAMKCLRKMLFPEII